MKPQVHYTAQDTEHQARPQSHEVDLNQFAKWQSEDPDNREVKIQIRNRLDYTGSNLIIWVSALVKGDIVCQRVWNVEEIDLEAQHKKQLQETLERVKAQLEI